MTACLELGHISAANVCNFFKNTTLYRLNITIIYFSPIYTLYIMLPRPPRRVSPSRYQPDQGACPSNHKFGICIRRCVQCHALFSRLGIERTSSALNSAYRKSSFHALFSRLGIVRTSSALLSAYRKSFKNFINFATWIFSG